MNSLSDDDCVKKVHEIIKTEANVANNPYFDMLIEKV
jgi:hypothetical protein